MSQESLGFTELSQKVTSKTVDVVAVHGLQGSAIKTWEHSNGSMWLKDFLAPELPFVRVMTFGYDSTVLLSKSVAEIEDKALELLNQLSLERISLEPADSNGRPIIFIGHSLGGILVKKAIILAHERSDEPGYKDVLDSTKGIAFLGTPHRGSDSAWWGAIVANIVKGLSIGTSTNSRLVSDLKKDSSSLGSISSQFVHRTRDIRIYTFYETKKTGSVMVVDKTSATMGLPNEKLFAVDADHRNICKFPSVESSAYKAVGSHVALLVKGALKPIEMALSKDYSECMRALELSNPDATRYKIAGWAQGTCTWLLKHPRYLEWINGSEKALLWVTGAPGSGKTVLSSFVVDQIESTKSPRNVGFFFADDGSKSQRFAVMLLRGLLCQILSRNPSLFKHAQVHWKRTAEGAFEDLSLLWRICTACFDDPLLENAVFVLDALDECAKPDCEYLLKWVIQYFTSRPAGSTQVKFFLTSRPEIWIADILDKSAIRIKLEIHNDTDWLSKDIEVFIAVAVNTLPAMREWSSERKEHIRHRLVQNADRTFLWVSLVLQKLPTEAMLSENAFTTMLSAIPDGLEDIYHSILMSIPSCHREAAKRMLSIITMSTNPLSEEQLRKCWAVQSKHLSVHDMKGDLEPDIRRTVGLLCGQIVRWEKVKPKPTNSHRNEDSVEQCRLVHQSAKDFLFSDPKLPKSRTTEFWYHLDLASATRIIANKCIWFVNLRDFSQLPIHMEQEKLRNSIIVRPDILRSKLHECCNKHPFLDYAVHNWPHHLREYEQLQPSLKSMIYDPTDMQDPTDYAATLYNYNVPIRAHWFMKMLRLADMPLDQEKCQIPPIVFCAYNGHASVMPKLIDRTDGPDINAPMAQMTFSALHAAALGKHSHMVDWLLANEANIQATDAWNRTPLHIAARRNNEDILRCLLLHHADTSAKDKFGMTPIQGAQERGFSENVKILAQQSMEADPILLVMPDLDQTQDAQARHDHGVDDFDLEDPYQLLLSIAQHPDENNVRVNNEGINPPPCLPELLHSSGSSDSSERRSLSLRDSESSRHGSRRSLSRRPSSVHLASSSHGSLRRSSSVGSYRGKTRSRSLDLQSEPENSRKHPPASMARGGRNSRRSSSVGSYRGKTRSRSLDLQSEPENSRKYPPTSMARGGRNSRRSSSVGSYRGKTRSRSLDLQSEPENSRKYPPTSMARGGRSSRRSSSFHKGISTHEAPKQGFRSTSSLSFFKKSAGTSDTNPRYHTSDIPARVHAPLETILNPKEAVLTTDGGIASSYSTLLLLRELMKEITKLEEGQSELETLARPANRPAELTHLRPPILLTPHQTEHLIDDVGRTKLYQRLPCHYFSYIAGSSFGGLLAVMLGRLRMNIDDCILEYGRICTEIFGHCSSRPRSLFPRKARNDRSDERLRYITKDILHRRLPRKYGLKISDSRAGEEFAFDEDRCRTAVLVLECQPSVGSATPSWIQSYNSPTTASMSFKSISNRLPVWQVALASIASPSHIHPVKIDGVQYQDVSPIWDIDPCATIFAEVYEAPMAVSIGPEDYECSSTKRSKIEYPKNLPLAKYALNSRAARYKEPHVHYRFKTSDSVRDRSCKSIGKIKALRSRVERKLSTMKYISEVLRGSDSGKQSEISTDEPNHISSCADTSTPDSLREFPTGHRTLQSIAKHTEAYLLRYDVQARIAETARVLVKSRRYRAQKHPAQWERECYGLRYECVYGDCVANDVEYASRDTMRSHLLQRHLFVVFADELESILDGCRSFVI